MSDPVFPLYMSKTQQPGTLMQQARAFTKAERRYDRALLSTPLRIGAAEPGDLARSWCREAKRQIGDREATRLGADARAQRTR